MMKDYRISVKVRNNRILKAIEDVGGTPGGKWCESNNLNYCLVNDLINMTISPLTSEGEMRKVAVNLCEVLGKLPEDLWSNEQLYPLERNFSEMEMDYEQVISMLPKEEQFYIQDFSGVEEQETAELVFEAISTLTKREQQVINGRFYENKTLVEIANEQGVSHHMIRQIEQRALRKLRRPNISRTLRDAA